MIHPITTYETYLHLSIIISSLKPSAYGLILRIEFQKDLNKPLFSQIMLSISLINREKKRGCKSL